MFFGKYCRLKFKKERENIKIKKTLKIKKHAI